MLDNTRPFVSAVLAGDKIVASISDSDVDNTYAFYIYKNGKKITTVSYSQNSKFEFSWEMNSSYVIEGFIKTKSGDRIRLERSAAISPDIQGPSSNDFFVNPVVVPLDTKSAFPDCFGQILVKGEFFDYPILFKGHENKKLFVLLSAAVDRKKVVPPIFHRWRWAHKFPGMVMCVADPSLSLDENYALGWYLGTEINNVTSELAIIIKWASHTLGVASKDIVFYGSSGGGFASLALSAEIPGSTAVSINGQTLVLEYEIKRSVNKMMSCAFPGRCEDELLEAFSNRLSMIEKYLTARKSSHVILVQNTLDVHHYSQHFKPLCSVLGLDYVASGKSIDGRHQSIVYTHPNGHGPEPFDLIPKIIEAAISCGE